MLTPDDIRILIEFVGEDSRRGNFERIFPAPNSRKYQRYFVQQRYYNMLLDAWCRKYAQAKLQGSDICDAAYWFLHVIQYCCYSLLFTWENYCNLRLFSKLINILLIYSTCNVFNTVNIHWFHAVCWATEALPAPTISGSSLLAAWLARPRITLKTMTG